MTGPCSGSVDGKCETFKDRECVWHAIYNSLKERGELKNFETRLPMNMKDFSKTTSQAERRVNPINIKSPNKNKKRKR
jgi:hypothetical protein